MRCNNNPFFAQRVPTLFPGHNVLNYIKLEQIGVKEFSGTYRILCREEFGLFELKNRYLAQASLIRNIYQSDRRLNPIVQNAAKRILYQVEIEKKTRSRSGSA